MTKVLVVGISVALAAVVVGCSSGNTSTPLPSASSAAPITGAPATEPIECKHPLASYAPQAPLPKPADMPPGSTMREIQERGRLIAGVSADTLLLAARNPLTGKIEGFDVDMVKAVAKAIFGDENRYELKVITSKDRIPALEDRAVDMVARNMSIDCDRWTEVAFSSEYFRARQTILVRSGSGAHVLHDLAGKRVCGPAGSTDLVDMVETEPSIVAVGASTHTGCLVQFEEGDVDAITGDDTVLVGLAEQDPYSQVSTQATISIESYGLAFNRHDVDLVRFVNGVLEQLRHDGGWASSYERWFGEAFAPAPIPDPPEPEYGRTS